MRRILFLCFIIFAAMAAAGQKRSTDSLENVLETRKLSGKEQLIVYYKLCRQYRENDLEKFILYANTGLRLAEKQNDEEYIMDFNKYIGESYYIKGIYDTAIIYYEKVLEMSKRCGDEEMEAVLYGNIGNVYCVQAKDSIALDYYIKSLPLFEKVGKRRQLILTLTNIVSIYYGKRNFDRALYYIEQAKDILDEIPDCDNERMFVYYYLGDIYGVVKGDVDGAMEYALKTLELSRTLGDKQVEVMVLQSMAGIYCHNEDFDAAEKCALESLRTAEEYDNPRLLTAAWKALSVVYLKQKRYDECDFFAVKAWEADTTLSDGGQMILSNIVHANIHLGNKEKAVQFFQKYSDFMNENSNKNYMEVLSAMEVRYETEKKDMRIASLEKERQLYIWLGIAGALLALALGVLLWQNARSARKEKQLIATRSVLDGEMSERTRLARDLHDRLGGNLSAVKIGLSNSAESIENICDKLDSCIDELRRVSHNLMPTSLQHGLKVALEDFTAQFDNVYFHFFGEEKRAGDRVEFIIYCCANELVNNALRYSDAKNINVQLVQDDKHVSLTVQDDGIGFDEKNAARGIGLKNIRDRVMSCDGKIDIITAPGKGTEITIEIKTGNI